jgi:RNA polymerase sigma-70 factor (ECF subfamily)
MSARDQQAFLDLLQPNVAIIHKVIRLYAEDEEDRRDLYQEVVCQAWSAWERFEGQSKFSTWLYRVALNTALTFDKRRRRKVPEPVEGQALVPPPSVAYEARELLYWAMSCLGEIDRMIILLHLEGYDHPEIAGITATNANHIAVKIHRIKKRLTEILAPYRDGF